MIPSDTGISFAVAWDPVEDAAVFSGARLVQSATGREDPISPTDIVDTHSQVLTIGPSSILVSENTGTLGYFRDQQDLFFSAKTPQFDKRMAQEQARSSSTRSGIDVYLRGSVLGNGRRQRRRKASGGDGLDMDFQQDPITSFVRLCLRYADGEIEQPHTEDGPSRRPSVSIAIITLNFPTTEHLFSDRLIKVYYRHHRVNLLILMFRAKLFQHGQHLKYPVSMAQFKRCGLTPNGDDFRSDRLPNHIFAMATLLLYLPP